jgi:hypothetical protein
MYFASCDCIVEELWLSRSEPAAARRCVTGPTPPIKIEGTSLLNRTGLESKTVGVRPFLDRRSGGERKRKTVSLGKCATQWVSACDCVNTLSEQVSVPSTRFTRSQFPYGYLFTRRGGRLLDKRNTLKALHGAGKREGFHAFRQFLGKSAEETSEAKVNWSTDRAEK